MSKAAAILVLLILTSVPLQASIRDKLAKSCTAILFSKHKPVHASVAMPASPLLMERRELEKKDARAKLAILRIVELTENKFNLRTGAFKKLVLSSLKSRLTEQEIEEAQHEGESRLRAQLLLAGLEYDSPPSARYKRILKNVSTRLVRSYIETIAGLYSQMEEKEKARAADVSYLDERIDQLRELELYLLHRGEMFRRYMAVLKSDPAADPISFVVATAIATQLAHPEARDVLRDFGRSLAAYEYVNNLMCRLNFSSRHNRAELQARSNNLKTYVNDLILAEVIDERDRLSARAEVDQAIEGYRVTHRINRATFALTRQRFFALNAVADDLVRQMIELQAHISQL